MTPNDVDAASSPADVGRARTIASRSRSLQSCVGRTPARRAASSRQVCTAATRGSTCARRPPGRGSGWRVTQVDVADERAHGAGVAAATCCPGDDEPIGRTGERHVEQAGLLGLGGGRARRLVGHEAALDTGHRHRVPLASLRGMEREEIDPVGGGVVEGVRRCDPCAEGGAVAERLFAKESERRGSDAALGIGFVGGGRVRRMRFGCVEHVVRPTA